VVCAKEIIPMAINKKSFFIVLFFLVYFCFKFYLTKDYLSTQKPTSILMPVFFRPYSQLFATNPCEPWYTLPLTAKRC